MPRGARQKVRFFRFPSCRFNFHFAVRVFSEVERGSSVQSALIPDESGALSAMYKAAGGVSGTVTLLPAATGSGTVEFL